MPPDHSCLLGRLSFLLCWLVYKKIKQIQTLLDISLHQLVNFPVSFWCYKIILSQVLDLEKATFLKMILKFDKLSIINSFVLIP